MSRIRAGITPRSRLLITTTEPPNPTSGPRVPPDR